MTIGLDIGSSSVKALVLRDGDRATLAARRPLRTHRRPGGGVELDAEEVWRSAIACLERALQAAGSRRSDDRDGPPRLGIATQRSTVLFWDRQTGRPLTPAYSWQDRRGAALCARLARRLGRSGNRRLAERTGLRLSPHYSASKMAWALRRVSGLEKKSASGHALWGNLGTFLLWRLTEGAVYAADHANAQRTLLFDIGSLAWDPDLFEWFGLGALLEAPVLPALVPTSLPTEVRVSVRGGTLRLAAMTGDQQAALLGMGCRRPGDVSINYGSGAFVLRDVGATPVRSPGLLTTLLASWSDSGRVPRVAVRFAVEGTVNAAATAIEWAERRLGTRVRTRDLDRALGPDDGSRRRVHFLPAVYGVGAPHWDPAARPRFAGDVGHASPRDLLRAVVESIAYRCAEILRTSEAGGSRRDRAPRSATGSPILAAGGLVRCRALLQAQADLLGRPLLIRSSPDATALGVALLARQGPRLLRPGTARAPTAAPARDDRIVRPRLSRREREARLLAWQRAVYRPAGDAGGGAWPSELAARRDRIDRS